MIIIKGEIVCFVTNVKKQQEDKDVQLEVYVENRRCGKSSRLINLRS